MAFSFCVIPSKVRLSDEGADKPATKLEMIALYVLGLIFIVYSALCIWSLYAIVKNEERKRKNYGDDVESIYVMKCPE